MWRHIFLNLFSKVSNTGQKLVERTKKSLLLLLDLLNKPPTPTLQTVSTAIMATSFYSLLVTVLSVWQVEAKGSKKHLILYSFAAMYVYNHLLYSVLPHACHVCL